MKYVININQLAIISNGIAIDIMDAAILDWMVQFSHSSKITKIDVLGKLYYYYSYQKIIQDLPILGIGRDAIYRRVKKMCDVGVLEACPNNQTLNKPFYALTDKALSIYLTDSTDPTVQTPNPSVSNTEPPTVQTPNDNNINTNNIKQESSDPAISFLSKIFTKWSKEEFKASIQEARKKRAENPKQPNFSKDMLNEFYLYWIAPHKSGKMYFATQDKWDTFQRLISWQAKDLKK